MFTVIFALLSAFTSVIICTAIIILLLAQLSRDRQSQALVLLVAAVASMSFLSSLLQTLGRIDGLGSPKLYMEILCIPAFLLPGLLFNFTRIYFEDFGHRQPIPRIVVWSYILQAVFTTTVVLTRGWLLSVNYLPDGTLALEPYPLVEPLNLFANIWLAANSWYAGYLLVANERRTRRYQYGLNKRVYIGLLLINLGNVGHALPFVIRYSLGINMFTFGLLLLIHPVLRQRLFDPLTRLNIQLKSRADQLQVIMRVGQQATSHLALDGLLASVVQDMRSLFGTSTITVYLTSDKGDLEIAEQVRASDSTVNVQPLFSLAEKAAQMRKVVYSSDGQNLGDRTVQEICVPLTTGNADTREDQLVGVLSLHRQSQTARNEDDVEVISILANQLAIAIRNAHLFQEVQNASASKTHFISVLSHEIRTPLQAIISNVGLMRFPQAYGHEVLPDAYKNDINVIGDQAAHIVEVINAVLDINKMEAGKLELNFELFSPFDLLEQVRLMAKNLLAPEVELKVDYSPSLPFLCADKTRLRQVLNNIVGNACKFTKHGQVLLRAETSIGGLCIVVADTGPGIAEETQKNLFKPFSQGSKNIAREYGGSGMGLVTAKRLVELHHGEISLTSALDVGTTVVVTLPVLPSDQLS